MAFITPHKDFLHFFEVLTDPGWFTSWKGDVIRQGAPRWMSRPFRLTGVGSVIIGGRWNVKGLMPAIYASTNPETLSAEVQYKGRHFGWKPTDFQAQWLVGMHWELQAVVDLTAPATLHALKVTPKRILSVDWNEEQMAGNEPVTQAIARAAFEHRAEGLVVPSARHPGGVNIVYFPNHRRDGSLIQTPDENALPLIHGL